MAFSYIPCALIGSMHIVMGQSVFFNIILLGVAVTLFAMVVASGFHPVVLGFFDWGRAELRGRFIRARAWLMAVAMAASLIFVGLVFMANYEVK